MRMVEAENVQKTYRSNGCSVDALRNINLTIEKGEMISIMGPSGCGKTTLLNCLSGLDDITSGSIKIEGKALEGMSDRDRTRHRAQRMGFIFQSFNLLPVLSAVENVELPLLISGVDRKEARPRALDPRAATANRHAARHRLSAVTGHAVAARRRAVHRGSWLGHWHWDWYCPHLRHLPQLLAATELPFHGAVDSARSHSLRRICRCDSMYCRSRAKCGEDSTGRGCTLPRVSR